MNNRYRSLYACVSSLVVVLNIATASHAQSTRPATTWPEVVRRLTMRVRTDPQARALFAPILAAADTALDVVPGPVAAIRSEGLLAGDPLKVATSKALGDMNALRSLSWSALITTEARYAEKAGVILRAWADVNHSRGDPIDDTKLESAIRASAMIGQSLPAADRAAIERWLRETAITEIKAKRQKNNWQNHRIKVIGLIGYALDDPAYVSFATDAWRKQLDENLRPDGSTSDFHDRDALHYHVYALEPLLALAAVAGDSGTDLYRMATPAGASLEKSVDFLRPFAAGERTHVEFVNSKSSFDRKRAANGEQEYQPHPWPPAAALGVFTAASRFDPQWDAVVCKLAGVRESQYAGWDALVASVRRETAPTTAPARR